MQSAQHWSYESLLFLPPTVTRQCAPLPVPSHAPLTVMATLHSVTVPSSNVPTKPSGDNCIGPVVSLA
jgi:hypothetical protein